MRARLLPPAALVLLLLAAAPRVEAAPGESGSAAVATSRFTADQIAAQAKAIEYRLAAAGARVAIVGRIGRDPATLPKGLLYTHVAFWVHSAIRTSEGAELQGYAVHNLYQRDGQTDRSELVQDFPVDFLAPAWDLKVAAIIPRPEMQQRLLATLRSPRYAKLHNPRYSVIANPAATRYQNCTSFVLDVVVASLYRTDDQAQIKANIATYFRPQVVEVGSGKRLLASLFARDVATADHGPDIRTATMETLAAFMTEYGLALPALEIPAQSRAP